MPKQEMGEPQELKHRTHIKEVDNQVVKLPAAEVETLIYTSEEQQWEHMEGWTYMGHGEWSPPEPMQMQNKDQSSPVEWDPEWICKWRTTVDEDIALHEAV